MEPSSYTYIAASIERGYKGATEKRGSKERRPVSISLLPKLLKHSAIRMRIITAIIQPCMTANSQGLACS